MTPGLSRCYGHLAHGGNSALSRLDLWVAPIEGATHFDTDAAEAANGGGSVGSVNRLTRSSTMIWKSSRMLARPLRALERAERKVSFLDVTVKAPGVDRR